MSQGGLERELVAVDFWPACKNCIFFATCKVRPRHPAYPHTWHWGREFAVFTDRYLITRSWVGTAAIGQPHTGCKSYEVDPHYVNVLQPYHRRYLDLEREKKQLERDMERLERWKVWGQEEAASHDALFRRYREVLLEQGALRSTVDNVPPLAVAVNG